MDDIRSKSLIFQSSRSFQKFCAPEMQKQASRRWSKIVPTEITSRTTDRFIVTLERCGGIV